MSTKIYGLLMSIEGEAKQILLCSLTTQHISVSNVVSNKHNVFCFVNCSLIRIHLLAVGYNDNAALKDRRYGNGMAQYL